MWWQQLLLHFERTCRERECFWLQGGHGCEWGSDLIIGRCEQERREGKSDGLETYSGKKKMFLRPCWLLARVLPINRALSKSGLWVHSRGDLAQPGTVKFFSGSVPWDSTYHISPPAATLTKTIKRSQRSAEENDSRLAPRIYCVKTNYNRVVPKISHLDRLATNKSLYFGL